MDVFCRTKWPLITRKFSTTISPTQKTVFHSLTRSTVSIQQSVQDGHFLSSLAEYAWICRSASRFKCIKRAGYVRCQMMFATGAAIFARRGPVGGAAGGTEKPAGG